MIVGRQPCKFCASLTEGEVCPECLKHHELCGHYPRNVQRRQVAGQPRLLSRFCGECGRELCVD